MQIQSKHVAKTEDVKKLEELAARTARNDRYHWIAIGILTIGVVAEGIILFCR